MLRTLHWKWVGLLALSLTPALALGQTVVPASHTVREGDTLWDLARHYRGDPFLWPDIYRMNTTVVADPHWIYPGEVLRLAGADTVPAVPTTDTPAPPPVADAPAPVPADSAPVSEAPAPVMAEAAPNTEAPSVLADVPQDGPQQTLAQLTAVSATEPGREERLFGPARAQTLRESLTSTTNQPYHAVRRSEFYSSGFLTESKNLPFGKLLGRTYPQQIRSTSGNGTALPYSTIAIEAPRGAAYQVGDTLLLLELGREIESHGDIVIPTGLAQILDTVQGRYVASVVATYGAVRNGQLVLPAEKFAPTVEAHAAPVSDGVRAKYLGGPGRQDLKAPQMVVFIDKGREDGVAPGDIFEIRRRAVRLPDGNQLINDVMATFQVVRVGDHTATGRLLSVLSPDIPPGTDAQQVAKLPS